MARFVESANTYLPSGPDQKGWRHFGDGIAGEIVAARLQAYNPTLLAYQDVVVDNTTGFLATAGAGGSGGGGIVQQGAKDATAQAWSTDPSDRVGRLLGHVTVDNASLPVTGTFALETGGNLATLADKDFATQTTLALIKAKTDNLDVLLSTRTKPADSQHVTVDNPSLAVTAVDTTFGATVTPKAASVWDVSDRAARLVGVVYGSQAQQLKQTATNFNLQSELAVGGTLIDPRAIRALTSADVVSAAQSGTWTVQPGNTANTTPWLVKSGLDNAVQTVLVAWEEMAGTAAVESTLTNTTFRTENLVATTAATSYTVPVGKRLRITNVSCYVKATAAVNNLARFRLRALAGTVLNTSAPVFNAILALDTPGTVAAGLLKDQAYSVPEGSLDFAAGVQITFTWNTQAATCTVGMSFVGYLYTP